MAKIHDIIKPVISSLANSRQAPSVFIMMTFIIEDLAIYRYLYILYKYTIR